MNNHQETSSSGGLLASDDQFEKPTFKNNVYDNPKSFGEWSFPPSAKKIYRFFRAPKGTGAPLRNTEALNTALPLHRPRFDMTGNHASSTQLSYTWIGHATTVVQMDGVNIITDPVWGNRAAPISFIGPVRYRPPPCEIAELPPMDVVLISHNHYDHLDEVSVKKIEEQFKSNSVHYFVPLGLRATLTDWGVDGARVTELNWGDTHVHRVPRTDVNATILCTPAQHWSQRGLLDRCKTLWSGWAVLAPIHRFYFAGDTGYCEQEFAKLGRLYGPFDLTTLPIGCYAPRDFMRPQHIGPVEAVRIHQMVRAKKSIGIHWGTFAMGSKEPYLEPRELLKEQAQKFLNNTEEFCTVNHGETFSLP